MTWTAQRVMRSLMDDDSEPQRLVVRLAVGESTWNPASTTSNIAGPATVEYARFRDGGITAHVEGGDT